jgi:putative transposase
LKQHETGVSVADLAREHGCSTAMVYQWRSKYGGMDASLMKRMKELEATSESGRHEWLDMHLFHSVSQVQLLAMQWLWGYNNERSNTAIGGVTPNPR